MNKYILAIGKFYELLYRLPLVGEWLVRSFVRSMGRIGFYFSKDLHRNDSIQGVKEDLVRSCKKMGILIEVSKEKADKFEFFVLECPYGYKRPDQQGVCDAAMDMDRVVFRLCGGNLVVEETIPAGAKNCRITMHKI